MPQLDGTVPSTRVAVIEVNVGLIEAGTYNVTGIDDVPISVEPLGGVHETEVEELLVQMVPVASPKEYVMVCVKDVEARVTVMVPAEPIVVAGMDMEDFRGIVRSVTVWLLFTLQPLPPLPSVV